MQIIGKLIKETLNFKDTMIFLLQELGFVINQEKLVMIPSSIWFGGIKTCWAQKITQEKSTKFIKTFELYKFFVPNCSDIPNVFINIETFWAQKAIPEKLTKFTKILNYVKSSGIMFCAEMLGCSGYIYLARRINTFWLKGFDKFWSGGIETIWAQTITKKIGKIQKDFWIIPSLYVSQNISISPNHILTMCTKNIFTTSSNSCHHLAPTLPTLYRFPTLCWFLSVKLVLFLFSLLLACTNPTILLNAML